MRQLGGGVVIAIVSILLVIGGISLALAETLPAQATPTPFPPTITLNFPTATFTPSPVFPETATNVSTLPVTATDTAIATSTLFVQVACNPPAGWTPVPVTISDTVYSLAQRYKTTPENLVTANCPHVRSPGRIRALRAPRPNCDRDPVRSPIVGETHRHKAGHRTYVTKAASDAFHTYVCPKG